MNIDIEVLALQDNIRADHNEYVYVTRKQVQVIVMLMRQGLESKEREDRIAVLRLLIGPAFFDITGQEVMSTKNMTSPIAKFLITQLKDPNSPPDNWRLSDYGTRLLASAEARVKSLALV